MNGPIFIPGGFHPAIGNIIGYWKIRLPRLGIFTYRIIRMGASERVITDLKRLGSYGEVEEDREQVRRGITLASRKQPPNPRG